VAFTRSASGSITPSTTPQTSSTAISAARFHPVNIFLGSVATDVVLLLAGISPNVLVFLGPFTVAHSAFVHANLNWTVGPLGYAIAGPVFHRWHHTISERGGEKNFASTFPLLDLMPKHELPDAYGVAERDFPSGFGAKLLYPSIRPAIP
jgi:sterol desaturase/sphingolipid hydroxylase (fatty acid hydroxylase superfamily)